MTGNMYGKFGEIWTCGFRDVQLNRQMDKQTNRYTGADRNTLPQGVK